MSPLPIRLLRRADLPADTLELARFMVGKFLVHDLPEGRISARLVETEAYPVGDSTSYAYRGRTHYNGALFEAPGHAYVRLVYGASYMINMSAEIAGVGAAVLLRAAQPAEGIELMQQRRPGIKLRDLARGPGRLCAAMGIDPRFDGHDLCGGSALWVGVMDAAETALAETGSAVPCRGETGAAKRIGLTREMHHLLRFYEVGSPFVSGPRRLLAPAR